MAEKTFKCAQNHQIISDNEGFHLWSLGLPDSQMGVKKYRICPICFRKFLKDNNLLLLEEGEE